jgi:hypothetical protein
MQAWARAVVVLAAVFWSGEAGAQVFGKRGDAALGAERLSGVHSDHVFQEDTDAQTPGLDYDVTTFGLGWFGRAAATPFDLPRLSFDYFIANQLSLGGALAYQTSTISSNGNRGGGADNSQFLFNPRVGYAHMFGRVVGIWPRAGITYHSETVSNAENINGFALSLEAPFVFVAAAHFALLLGPSLDLDFTGRIKPPQAPQLNHAYRSIGLQLGLLGWI